MYHRNIPNQMEEIIYRRVETNTEALQRDIWISREDENYMRLCMLIDIGRKAVKIYFDKEFDPKFLKKEIRKSFWKLHGLKVKNIISEEQWRTLQDKTLDSSDFDIPLMICLLRNLIPTIDIGDELPHRSLTKITDDIARIKFYRNSIAHANRSCLSDETFLEIWNNVSKAIRRISTELYTECESLQITVLDLLNKDIKFRIKRAFKEFSETLQKEYEILKEIKSNPIPPHLRVKFAQKLEQWREDDDIFIRTKGSNDVLARIQENPCVVVTGSFGMGKTAIIHHVALEMHSKGYTVIPVTDSLEINKYNSPIGKTLFVVDNFCGKCDLDEDELHAWDNCGDHFERTCKLLVSCKLQVYKAIRHDKLNKLTFHECNLLSEKIRLSNNERKSIARKYNINNDQINDTLELYNCFPLLCKCHNQDKITNTKLYFETPFEVFETQFEMLETLDANGKVCALMTLLMFYDHVPENLFTGSITWNAKYILANTREACKLNKEDSMTSIHGELENLIDTFVVKKSGVYKALNEHIFNLILRYFGQQMTESLVRYSCPSFMKERFQLSNPVTDINDYTFQTSYGSYSSLTEHRIFKKVGPNAIILSSKEHRKLYVTRMLTELSNSQVNNVSGNPNLFHVFVFEYLKKLDRIELFRYLTKTDSKDGSTLLNSLCQRFTITLPANQRNTNRRTHDFLQWLIDNGCPVDKSNNNGETAIFHSAGIGSLNSVRTLINNKADINICTNEGFSPLHMTCMNGHSSIAKLLLRSGANCNQLSKDEFSPLHFACFGGHIHIVTELLQHHADINKKNIVGMTPLFLSFIKGYSEIVKCLLQNGADFKTFLIEILRLIYISHNVSLHIRKQQSLKSLTL